MPGRADQHCGKQSERTARLVVVDRSDDMDESGDEAQSDGVLISINDASTASDESASTSGNNKTWMAGVVGAGTLILLGLYAFWKGKNTPQVNAGAEGDSSGAADDAPWDLTTRFPKVYSPKEIHRLYRLSKITLPEGSAQERLLRNPGTVEEITAFVEGPADNANIVPPARNTALEAGVFLLSNGTVLGGILAAGDALIGGASAVPALSAMTSTASSLNGTLENGATDFSRPSERDACVTDLNYNEEIISTIVRDLVDGNEDSESFSFGGAGQIAPDDMTVWCNMLAYLDLENDYARALNRNGDAEENDSGIVFGKYDDLAFSGHTRAASEAGRGAQPRHRRYIRTSDDRKIVNRLDDLRVNLDIEKYPILAKIGDSLWNACMEDKPIVGLQDVLTTLTADMRVLGKDPSGVYGASYNALLLVLDQLWVLVNDLDDAAGVSGVKQQLLAARMAAIKEIRNPEMENVVVTNFIKQNYPDLFEQGMDSTNKIQIHIWKADGTFAVKEFSVEELLNGQHRSFLAGVQRVFVHFAGDHSGLDNPDLTEFFTSVRQQEFATYVSTGYGDENAAHLFDTDLRNRKATPLYFNARDDLKKLEHAIRGPFAKIQQSLPPESKLTVDGLMRLHKENLYWSGRDSFSQIGIFHRVETMLQTMTGLLEANNLNLQRLLSSDYIYMSSAADGGKRGTKKLSEVIKFKSASRFPDVAGQDAIVVYPKEFPPELVTKLDALGAELRRESVSFASLKSQYHLRTMVGRKKPTLTRSLEFNLASKVKEYGLSNVTLSDPVVITYGAGSESSVEFTLGDLYLGALQGKDSEGNTYFLAKITQIPKHVPKHRVTNYIAMVTDICTDDVQGKLMGDMEKLRHDDSLKNSFDTYVREITKDAPKSGQWFVFPEAPYLLIISEEKIAGQQQLSWNARYRILDNNTPSITQIFSLINGKSFTYLNMRAYKHSLLIDENAQNFLRMHRFANMNYDVNKLFPILVAEENYYGKIIDWEKNNINRNIKTATERGREEFIDAFAAFTPLLSFATLFMSPLVGLVYSGFVNGCPELLKALNADSQDETDRYLTQMKYSLMGNFADGAVIAGIAVPFLKAARSFFKIKKIGLSNFLPASASNFASDFASISLDVAQEYVIGVGDKLNDYIYSVLEGDVAEDQDVFMALLMQELGVSRVSFLVDNFVPRSSNSNSTLPMQAVSSRWLFPQDYQW
jgi:hypothetical protein